jgi:hypothetical protein
VFATKTFHSVLRLFKGAIDYILEEGHHFGFCVRLSESEGNLKDRSDDQKFSLYLIGA